MRPRDCFLVACRLAPAMILPARREPSPSPSEGSSITPFRLSIFDPLLPSVCPSRTPSFKSKLLSYKTINHKHGFLSLFQNIFKNKLLKCTHLAVLFSHNRNTNLHNGNKWGLSHGSESWAFDCVDKAVQLRDARSNLRSDARSWWSSRGKLRFEIYRTPSRWSIRA